MIKAEFLEKKAHSLLAENKFDEAVSFFKEAGSWYSEKGYHKEAAICYSSAASCWIKKSGESTLYEAADLYRKAAQGAEKSLDFEYASVLYRYAAINYEREGEFTNFSHCFYKSKLSQKRFYWDVFINAKKLGLDGTKRGRASFAKRMQSFFLWLFNSFFFLLWGYGERPGRAFLSSVFVILVSALLYHFGTFTEADYALQPTLLDSLYFSVITFTTVGYGDMVPIGLTKMIAGLEAFTGIFMIPIFIIGLSRKYLRV